MKPKLILSILLLLNSVYCKAQSNVYRLSVYAGGTSYTDLCSLTLPFPPHRYKLSEISWSEDAEGFHIIDIRRKPLPTDVRRAKLEVECGSEKFIIPWNTNPRTKNKNDDDFPIIKDSGDLTQLVTQCVTNRGGHVATNTLPVFQAKWSRQTRPTLDVIIADADFAEVRKLLEKTYGKPNEDIRSSSPIGNANSFTYTPQQVGVMLNLTGSENLAIVSIIGKQKQ